MSNTQGDLVSAVRHRTGQDREHADEPEQDLCITDYTSAARRAATSESIFSQAVADHAREVAATTSPAMPESIASAIDVGLLRARLEAAERQLAALADRTEVLEAGWRLMARRLGITGIDVKDIR